MKTNNMNTSKSGKKGLIAPLFAGAVATVATVNALGTDPNCDQQCAGDWMDCVNDATYARNTCSDGAEECDAAYDSALDSCSSEYSDCFFACC
jgi:hypothetical protein